MDFKNGLDFTVEDDHLGRICDLLRCNVGNEYWEDIENEFMNRAMKNDVREYSTFLGRVRESISSWIRNASVEERKFSIFVAAVEKHDSETAGKLTENVKKLRDQLHTTIEKHNLQTSAERGERHKLLNGKWWPEIKLQINSHFERRNDQGSLLVESIFNALKRGNDNISVISQKATVSGMGGVGKTTTATWFANYYKDNYAHIIWIDCGEGSLSKSFKNLSIKLEIRHREELILKDLALEIFHKLSDYKCLFIFDNAECYVGNEGVKEVLPIDKPNFHCLITSRSTNWGDQRSFGEIQKLQLHSFSSEDSVLFLKKNLKDLEYQDSHLIELSTLLGHLPLALQIVVSTLTKKRRIKIKDYIYTLKTTESILTSAKTLNEYQKSIYKTMKYSLDLIQKEENGEIAFRILSIFAYISPDNIGSDFFAQIMEMSNGKVEDAFDLLAENSLITKTGSKKLKCRKHNDSKRSDELRQMECTKECEEEIELVSIHRLLQQVMRYEGNSKEKETLRRILNCAGFVEYKLIPYRYAEKFDELKEEFFNIRAQLIEQLNLETFWNEQRYAEADQLSRLIHLGISKKDTNLFVASLYNHTVCTWKNGEVEEAIKCIQTIFEIGAKMISRYEIPQIAYTEDFKLFDIKNAKGCEILAHLCVQLENHRGEFSNSIIQLKERIAHSLSVEFNGGDPPCDLNRIVAFRVVRVHGEVLHPTEKNDLQHSHDDFVMEQLNLFHPNCINRNGMQTANPFFHEMFNGRAKELVLRAKYKNGIRLDLSKLCDTIQFLDLWKVEISFTEEISSSLKKLDLLYCTITSSLNEILRKCYNLIELKVRDMNFTDLIPFSIPSTLKVLKVWECAFEISRNVPQITHSNDIPQFPLDYFEFDYNIFFNSEERKIDEICFHDSFSVGVKELVVRSGYHHSVEVDCSKLANCMETLNCVGNTRLNRSTKNSKSSLRILRLLNIMNPEGVPNFLFGCPHLVELQLRGIKENNVLTSSIQLPSSLKRLELRNVDLNFASHKLQDLQVEVTSKSLDELNSFERMLKSLSAENLCLQFTFNSCPRSHVVWKELVFAINRNNSTNIFLDCEQLGDAAKYEFKHIPGITDYSSFYLFKNGNATTITRKEWENILELHFLF